MNKLSIWALALSMFAGIVAFAADCCGDPACCAAGCCKNCHHAS